MISTNNNNNNNKESRYKKNGNEGSKKKLDSELVKGLTMVIQDRVCGKFYNLRGRILRGRPNDI